MTIAIEGVHGITGAGGAADNVAEAPGPHRAAMTSTEEARGAECAVVLPSTEVELTSEGAELTMVAAVSSGVTHGMGVPIFWAGAASGATRISAWARSSATPPADMVLAIEEVFTKGVAGRRASAAVSVLGAADAGVTALETAGLGPGERDLTAMFGVSPLLDVPVATCFVLEISQLEVLATDFCFFAAFGGPILIGRGFVAEVDMVSAMEPELELNTAEVF